MYKLYSNPCALARLAAGSAITVATLLSFPDAIVLAVNVNSLIVWMVRLLGIWLMTASLWFTGSLIAMLLARLLGGPVFMSEQGIRLWRFGKLVHWDQIESMCTEEQEFFAKAFFLKKPVYKLTMYIRHGKESLSPLVVSSFLFSPPEFESLVAHISQKAQGFVADAFGFALFDSKHQQKIRKAYKRTVAMRLAISGIILLGLIAFLSRKAIVAYEYNLGMKEFEAAHYEKAAFHLRLATATDPGFVFAWDRLGWTERNLHNEHNALLCWQKALLYKPDLVESKIGLAELAIDHREFAQAEDLLNQCVRLSPYQTHAYLYLAKLYHCQGKLNLSEEMLDKAVKNGNDSIRVYLDCIRLYKQYGCIDKAMKLTKFALQIHPQNLEAKQLVEEFRITVK